MEKKEKIGITDKNNNPVYVGDEFLVRMIEPSVQKPTKVRVVKDTSPENIECGRNYDVEDDKGNRLWNAYMVIKNGVKLVSKLKTNKYYENHIKRH